MVLIRNIKSKSILSAIARSHASDNKLFWTMLAHKSNGNAHYTEIIARYFIYFTNLYCIIVIVFWIVIRIIVFPQGNRLMSFIYVHIGIPSDITKCSIVLSIFTSIYITAFICIWNYK